MFVKHGFLLLGLCLFSVIFTRMHWIKACMKMIRFNVCVFMTVLFGIASLGCGTTLNLPSGTGGAPNATAWGTSGAVGTAAGNAIATANGGGVAATFGVTSQYVLQTPAYFDISALGAGAFTIDPATSDVINIGGMTFTVNAVSGQTVTFGAALKNLQVSTGGGLTVSGGGSVKFDNTNSTKQYNPGMDIGALYIDGSTVTLPVSSMFGTGQSVSNSSYSSITLANGSTLILNSRVAIGSRFGGISVDINVLDSNSTIQLAGGAITAYITPIFNTNTYNNGSGDTVPDTLNINTNGGILNMYGNNVNGTTGTAITLNVNDTATSTGSINLYGSHSVSAGGADYSNTNVNVTSGRLNLYLDADSQSLQNITMTGGTVTGSAYIGVDVTMSGASKMNAVNSTMNAVNITMNNLTMSGTASVSGRIQTCADLNLSDNAVFAPSTGTTVVGGNLNANSETPSYVVSYDGTNISNVNVTGTADVSALQIELLLSAGTYSTGSQNFIIMTSAGLTVPTVEPKWNIDGVFLDSGKIIPATGDEVDLSLTSDGSQLTLALTINKTLYVNTPVVTDYVEPFTPTSAPSTIVDTASLINATFSNSASSSDTMMQSTQDNFRFASTSTNPFLPRSAQSTNVSLLESIIRATEASGPISVERNETRIWASPYTSRSRVNNSAAGIGQQGWSGGSLIGFEKRDVKNIWTVGMLTGLTLSKFHNNGDPDTHSKANGYVMGIYNTLKYTDNKDAGNFGHEVLISRITNLNTMQRRGEQSTITYFAKAANTSVTNLGNAQFNYIFNLEKAVTCRLSLGGTYTDETEGAYTETNAGMYGNRVGGKNTKSGEVYFGPGLRHIWKDGPRTYRLTGVYEYGVSVYNKGNTQTTTTLAAMPHVLTNAPSGGKNKHYLQLNGSYLNKETGLKFSGAYSGTFYKDTQNHTFTAKAELRF